MDADIEGIKGEGGGETGPGCSGYSSMVHSKKVIKHALRQQAKRRRKNTTIAAGNSRTLPRIVVKPLPPPPPDDDPPSPVGNVQHTNPAIEEPAVTMREVLASLPGFSLKSGRRRSTKRLSVAAQLEAGLVDLESPASILASTSLRALLNRHTFQGLPPLYQRKLAQLLPAVDRQDAATSGLNNEFFARACLEWRKRLAEGEFTPENQQRLKMEAERDKNKLDPWKLKHFEPIWGEKREPKLRSGLHCIAEARSGGAVTRSSLRLRLESAVEQSAVDRSTVEQSASERIPSSVSAIGEKMESDVGISENDISTSEIASETRDTRQSALQRYEEPVRSSSGENRLEEPPNLDSMQVVVRSEICEKSTSEEAIAVENRTDERVSEIMKEEDQACLAQTEQRVHRVPESPLPNANVSLVVADGVAEMSSEKLVCLSEQVTRIVDEQFEHVVNDEKISRECLMQHRVADENVSETIEAGAEISQLPEEKSIPQMPESDISSAPSTASPGDRVGRSEFTPGQHTISNRASAAVVASVSTADGEPQIPEGMEIDSETLQRIHELEVRGEMREAYEEISGCPEEIIYPILEGMAMGPSGTEETEVQGVTVQAEDVVTQQDMAAGNEDEALREANNYVCSEMLECSWAVDPTVSTVNNIGIGRTQEELQVPWPLVAAALDGSVAANITVTTQDEGSDTSTATDTGSVVQQSVNSDAATESVNCVQLPVVQGAPFQPESLTVGAPVTSCLMKSVQSPSPPIIAFPQLQSIRFVQTSFHSGQNTSQTISSTNPVPVQLQSQPNPPQQISIVRTPEEVVQIGTHNVVPRNAVPNNVAPRNQVQSNAQTVCAQSQNRTQNAIMVQHQTPITTEPRQVVATVQQPQQQLQQQQQQQQLQQQYPAAVTVSSRSSRSTGQGGQRGSRAGNKEQGGGRSRSSTKEPPGAVNLERSYQICQAVIQSSPNRDQLKAHLKPPPSLLARGDGAFTTSKSGGRTVTTVKTQKPQQPTQHISKQAQTKTQAVMLRHVFTTARQAIPTEVTESNAAAQLGPNGTGGLGQYILVQRTGVGDGAPRASSAPPLPPQIAGLGVGVHLVRGRPASAGEGSHQAVTLKARGASDGRGGGGAEPGAPGVIMGGDPPPPCECNMRGAMVICRQCGAFCHDDCIGPQRICATCLIR